VVRAAAVIGREVEFGLLSAVVGLDEDLVIDSVEQAVAAGFLIEAGRSWEGSYEFAHQLTRDAVYADVTLVRRQRLHLRAAQALLSARVPDLPSAARHLRSAGSAADPAQTADVSLRAADHAARMYAWDEAVSHADAAAELLSAASDRAAGDAAMRAGLIRIRASIGFPEAVRHLQDALGHYLADGDAGAAGMAHSRLGGALSTHHSVMDIPRAIEHFAAAERALADPDAAFHLRRGQALAAMFGLRNGLLGTAAEQMERTARHSGRADFGAQAAWGQGWFRFNRGELARAEEYRESAWAAAHDTGDPYAGWGAVDSAALCATDYLLDPVAGRAWCRRGLDQPRFDTYAHPHAAVLDQLVLALAFMGDLRGARDAAERLPEDAVGRRLLLFLDGDWERAERAWATALAADEARGDRNDAAYNARWLAAARRTKGDIDGAVEAFQHALAIAVDGPQVPTEVHARAELARVLAGAGDVPAAADHLGRCHEILAGGEDWRGLTGVVALAEAAVADANGTDPGDGFARAVEIFTTFQVPWRRADALLAWADRLHRAGDRITAGDRRDAACASYERMGAAAAWLRVG
jgi:tetratricopeptide (TPR) repeat protein